ncbi:hypothetical protein BDZ94DRAFT_1264797 [Collybia nuda]|uniref:Uncharacterized protein n=1 Tax=Collybia nuda TaxID=64659 RepID=A0A9P5Y256_9AGAR|nr:hypothetical protein BDZ94DRAFT_1264797 [Collybia nuda]
MSYPSPIPQRCSLSSYVFPLSLSWSLLTFSLSVALRVPRIAAEQLPFHDRSLLRYHCCCCDRECCVFDSLDRFSGLFFMFMCLGLGLCFICV